MVGIGHGPVVAGPSRGDIHLVAFPDAEGHVLGGPHPAVIVQTDRMRRSSTSLVVPLTSAVPSAAIMPRTWFASSADGRACPATDTPSATR